MTKAYGAPGGLVGRETLKLMEPEREPPQTDEVCK